MMDRYALKVLSLLVLSVALALAAPLQAQSPPFQGPLLLTSAGQSPDLQLAGVLARRSGVEHTVAPLATAADLANAKALGLVLGASLKGLGAAGIDTNKEKERVRALLAEARRRNIPVLVFHLGGEQRRGQLTDEMVVEYFPAAHWALVVRSGNQDGLFTRLARERSIPLNEVDRTADGADILKRAFQPAG